MNRILKALSNSRTGVRLGKLPLKLKLIYDRQSVGQSVLVSGTHLGPVTNIYFVLEIFFRQLRACYSVAPFLTRGRVCNLLNNCFWTLPEQSLLGRSPTELTTIFYCLIWDYPNLESQVHVFISPKNRVAQLYLGHWVPFLSPITTRRNTICLGLRHIATRRTA
jgi:hypothetical protein